MHRSQHPISPAISLANSDKSNVSPALPTRVEAVPKTHVANKRLRKEGNQEGGETSPDTQPVAKRAKPEAPKLNGDHYDSVGSDCEIVSVTPARPRNRKKAPKDRTDVTGEDIVKEKLASIARIPKVKTTQELLADLRSRSSEAPSNCVLPVVDHDVARNKTEHIARFLRSQGDEEDEVIEVVHTEETSAAPSEVESKEEKPTLESPEEILARLPPLDLDSINWDESPLPSPTPHQVTEEDVDRVLNQHIEGINGNRDEKDKDSDVFCEWHQVVSRTSYQGDLLHILPYVVID
jgi:mediator of RNA polymerase II transcription subunit 26